MCPVFRILREIRYFHSIQSQCTDTNSCRGRNFSTGSAEDTTWGTWKSKTNEPLFHKLKYFNFWRKICPTLYCSVWTHFMKHTDAQRPNACKFICVWRCVISTTSTEQKQCLFPWWITEMITVFTETSDRDQPRPLSGADEANEASRARKACRESASLLASWDRPLRPCMKDQRFDDGRDNIQVYHFKNGHIIYYTQFWIKCVKLKNDKCSIKVSIWWLSKSKK